MPATPTRLFVADDGHTGPTLCVGRVANHQAERPEVDLGHSGADACVAVFEEQRRQSVTPFMEQTWQMNVPHPWQG